MNKIENGSGIEFTAMINGDKENIFDPEKNQEPLAMLPNGSVVIDRKRVATDKEIVLAFWKRNGRTEFITWAVYRDDDKSTSHGNYFDNLKDAFDNFMERN